jgi:citrate synthase
VSPGPDPRIHGYAVEGDLAPHYRFSDVIYLSLTGELPTDAQSRTFERALILLSPISIAEAPSHAASLARVCDATHSAVIGTGAIALAEQARFMVANARSEPAYAPIFAMLEECGIRRDDQLEAVWVVARIAVVAAEGLATPPASFRDYPLNVPAVRYEEEP